MVKPAWIYFRRWDFVADMNGDGLITISDVSLWFKWLYFYPGDFVISSIGASPFGTFLELSEVSFGSFGSGLASLFFWLMIFVPFAWWEEHQRNMERNRAAAENFYAEGEKALLAEDFLEAYAFFNKSASWIYFGSGRDLRRRATKVRNYAASKMTPSQIAEALKRTWTTKIN